jgi:nicotinate-nucleotide--dimethylbenzimidazole phosphoribosyltransferase
MVRFDSFNALRAACHDLPCGDDAAADAAARHQAQLTKPAGSLGRLEELALWVARWQGAALPRIDRATIAVFAGNHGIAARGVSAYPSAVTAQMVANFTAGGAAINQLASVAAAELRVVPIDLDTPTDDFTVEPAMTERAFLDAVTIGRNSVPPKCQLLAVGEMGIGNTTAASALCAALSGEEADAWIGRGTGVDDDGLVRKRDVVSAGLERHRDLADPLRVAAALGGRELAAILGAVLAARHRRIPVLLDGFVACAAMLPLAAENPDSLAHCRAAHRSAEAAHGKLLTRLDLDPLLDFDMRLGEGSGAALAIQLVRAALACHAGMATFANAGVATAIAEI